MPVSWAYAVHDMPGAIQQTVDAVSAAYMGDGHGIGVTGHREEFVVTLLVEHPANRSRSGVSVGLQIGCSSFCTGLVGLIGRT